LRTKPLVQGQVDSNVGGSAAPAIVHEVLGSPGRPLDPSTSQFMESRFGHDFSQVRVHTDDRAAESARAVSARAYTVGRNIAFGAGQYAPGTMAGDRLMAHELAHILQQAEGSAVGAVRISDPRDPAEIDAERAANDSIAAEKVHVMTTAKAGTMHRQPLPDVTLRYSPRITRLMGSELLDEFALESYTLTEDHKGRLAILAQTLLDLLRQYPYGGIRITGHADATGDEAFNEWLGQKRADAVREFLISAGVPATALAAVSAGERELRVKTKGLEPRNRRVEVRFETEPPGRFLPEPKLTPPRLASEEERPKPPLFTPREPEAPTACGSTTDCAAVSRDRFDKQPAALRSLIKRSFPDDPAGWFAGLTPELGMALTSIFNRLCQHGLLCQVRLIVRIDAGEAPVSILDRRFNVPGHTPSVYFTSPAVAGLPKVLIDTGRFCMAAGLGASQHPGPTLREISGSDSLHISVEGKDQVEAHIDRYSPVPEHPGSTVCSNAPTPAAIGHITRELVPEWWRKILLIGFPGLELSPEPLPRAPVPPGAVGSEPLPEVARLTLRGPVKERQRQKSDVVPLPDDIERRLADEIPKHIRRNALVPPGAERQLEAAALAAVKAGPGEEEALVAAREAARERLESFAEDAHHFAQDLARRMAQARRSGRPDFAVLLGPIYGELTPDDRRYVLAQIRDIARIVRALLAERAAGVHKIWVAFGESIIWDVNF
jgi:outer membrane protein OmpA-like peptidoglycan-associated protein